MPNLHPLIVHFPIALLLVAVLLELVAILRRKPVISRAAWWNQIAGSAGLALAVASGLFAESTVRIGDDARALFERHEQIAFAATTLFALLLFWRIGSRGEIPSRGRTLFLLCLAAGGALLVAGAFSGGELVYLHGIGVR
jgi:uncharacterized membrane protein